MLAYNRQTLEEIDRHLGPLLWWARFIVFPLLPIFAWIVLICAVVVVIVGRFLGWIVGFFVRF